MSASYAIAEDVAWVSEESLDDGSEPTAYVTTLPNGPAVVLRGPACLVWLALAESINGSVEEIVGLVAGAIGVEPEGLTADVEELLRGLVDCRVAARA